jgi:hypothetical protein
MRLKILEILEKWVGKLYWRLLQELEYERRKKGI